MAAGFAAANNSFPTSLVATDPEKAKVNEMGQNKI